MTDDDKTAVAEVEKEWPDVHKGVGVLLRQQAHNLEQKFAKTLYAVVQRVGELVNPALEAHNMTAQEKHFAEIRGAHSDFDTLTPKVEEWIAKQPDYLKGPMKSVLDQGTSTQVNDLYTRYKQANPAAAPAAPATTTPAAPAASTTPAVPDAAALAAAAALAPVKSGGASPKPGAGVVDKSDFAGAFAEATAGEK